MIVNRKAVGPNTLEQRSKRRKDLNLGSIRQITLSVLIVSAGYPDDSMRCKLGDSHDRCVSVTSQNSKELMFLLPLV